MYDFWENISVQFYSTLIEANRYKLILNGLWVTIVISFFAIILGTVLGLLTSFAKLSDTKYKRLNKFLHGISYIYVDIIRGTPFLIQLLIFAQVIFAKVGITKIVIAIIAFGVNSGAYVSEIFRAGILAVDKGQMEAGRSLGLSKMQAMFRIVMPQAIKNVIPALANEFVVLIKETSVVGYIALQDLTKAADFITSRTYKAFFPLITAGIIYYIIIKILTLGIQRLERRLRRSDLR